MRLSIDQPKSKRMLKYTFKCGSETRSVGPSVEFGDELEEEEKPYYQWGFHFCLKWKRGGGVYYGFDRFDQLHENLIFYSRSVPNLL